VIAGELRETSIRVNGAPTRVWIKGAGPLLGYVAGVGGLTRWIPFLDRLAEHRTVVVPSLPGFPGGGSTHLELDTILDWLLAVRDTLLAAGLDGADLVASNAGAALVADAAGLWPSSVRRLVLIAPHGLFDEAEPPADLWAQKPGALAHLLCQSGMWAEQRQVPDGADSIEWQIEQIRANEAVARIFWPLGATGLAKRLGRITAPTLLLRGASDRVLPARYLAQFSDQLGGENKGVTIDDAGHIAEFDQPDRVAEAVLQWVGQ